jgi:diguanylate cyclase (GGDEF)-like protein
MDLLSALIEVLVPRTVMTVGGFIAIATAIPLAIQSLSAGPDRYALTTATLSLLFAALSLLINAPLIPGPSSMMVLTATLLGTASNFASLCCLLQLFRWKIPRSMVIGCAAICLMGFALWPEGLALSRWGNVCQLLTGLMAVVALLFAKDSQAPKQRRLILGVCLFFALSSLPRLLTSFTATNEFVPMIEVLDTPELRIEALLWTIAPILGYAGLIGVIQTRVATRLRDTVDLDHLTGARSRHFLFDAGPKLLLERRSNHAYPPTAFLIDIDHFKRVNDKWGHVTGDNVLKHCVQCIRDVLRADDAIVARYGGEEFCVLLANLHSDAAAALAERIRLKIADTPYCQGEQSIPVTVSIGVAQAHEQASLSTLINHADKELYRAKLGGRDRVVLQGGMPAFA